ncbi:hypothetical protein CYY_002393 [Polysphondylium violaceum]|uniref:Rho-GAP domain-containing protein n=1 Tax=Polysphondylium violaceum TaxID=133409 RepID=A0A8J4PWL4_9MYCE|nr:hypothetical protein CYY_002393 [Polysphondylium violaceum]
MDHDSDSADNNNNSNWKTNNTIRKWSPTYEVPQQQSNTPRENTSSTATTTTTTTPTPVSLDDALNEGGIVQAKQAITNLLNKFLKSRPTKDDLVQNKILKSEYKPIPLRYSLIDHLCNYIEKNALSLEGVFRISGSNHQIRLLWSTFASSDNIEFPLNIHTTAGALKLYIREQHEPLIAYEHFSTYISQLVNDTITTKDIVQLMNKVSADNIRVIKRILRTLIILARHSELNKMDANNMGIVFGPNLFKSKPDSLNIFSEAKYSNESVTFLITNYQSVFPDLEIPILGTETNTEDATNKIGGGGGSGGSAGSGAGSSSGSDATNNNNNSSKPISPSSTSNNASSSLSPSSALGLNSNSNTSGGNANPPLSPLVLSSPSSIINSKSLSKTQLQPIHPSLENSISLVEKVNNPISQYDKKDFSMIHHLSSKLAKTKHFKNEQIWDQYLVLKICGNLINAQKSIQNAMPATNTTNNNTLKKKSNSFQQQQQQVSLVPMYILVSSANIFFFDTQQYEIQHILPHNRLKEISLDVVNKGLFSILDAETHKISYFLVPKPKVIDLLVRNLEKGRAIAKVTNKGMANLQARKFPLLEANGSGNNQFGKLPESRPVFESLASSGFSELDVWEGTVDLLEVVKKFSNILVPAESKAVVEFLLPNIPQFNGIYRKSYKLDIKTSVYKIICLICEKAKLEPTKFLLRTLKGRTLFDNVSLSDYGLGTLFTAWQLRFIALDSPESTGNFVVEFWMPDSPEFKGMQKKAIKVDAYQPLKRIMKGLCDKLKIPNHHYYHLIGPEGEILGDNDILSSIGLGIKFKTCKMKLAKNKFPIGTNPELDTPMVKSLVNDIIEGAWTKIRDRHNERIKLYCKHMLDYIVDQTFVEISKAETVPKRVAMLSKNSRYEFYQTLAIKEEEELIISNTDGYRNSVIKARCIVDQEPEQSPNYPLYRPKINIGKGPITSLRDIKINSAKTGFLSELKAKSELNNVGNQNNNNSPVSMENNLRPQKTKAFSTPVINNPNTIVSLLSLKPGTSKLVEQLKMRMSIKFNASDVEDLVPKGSPIQTRRNKL